MSSLGDRHKEGISLGSGKCSKPMWDGSGMPAGFCDSQAYGPQTELGRKRYTKFVPALACIGHGGPSLSEAIKGRVVIRFDGPPSHESGRFIEVERDGASISFGEWVQDGDDWLLVLPDTKGAQ